MNSVPLNIWLKRLKEAIVPPELNDDLIRAFLNHLADLKIFKVISKERWELCGICKEWDETTSRNLMNQLNILCETEEGFAVGYFLRNKKDYIPLNLPNDLKSDKSEKFLSLQELNIPSKSSDLSNLQIVKKVGRQLSPFLEMEKKCIAGLTGPNTSKKAAQMMYRYILERTHPKPTPLPWQQLSRRRHR